MNAYDLYKQYLDSDTWAELRNRALLRDNYHCSICNNPNNLEVHHLKYPDILGTEPISDLMTLCRNCHKRIERYKSDHYAKQKMTDWVRPKQLYTYFYVSIEISEWNIPKYQEKIVEKLNSIENCMPFTDDVDRFPIEIDLFYYDGDGYMPHFNRFVPEVKVDCVESIKNCLGEFEKINYIQKTSEYRYVNFDEYI